MSHLTRPSVQRLGALVAAGTLTTGGLVASLAAPAQAADTDPRPLSIGASWLETQLTNGIVVGYYYDENDDLQSYDDFGLTLDAGISLANVGGHAEVVADVADALAARPTEAYESFGTTYTGSAAKEAVFAELAGEDPRDFGSTDLIGVVEDNTATADPIAGRIENANDSFGDANVFGQSFAARALAEAGSSEAADAISFLLAQQCDDGFFRLGFTEDKTATDQTCQGAVGTAASVPDTDATALAVLQLSAISNPSQAVTDALADAETWLLAAQRADGSFGGGTSTEASNTNSTGLAGWALGALGDDAAATRAAAWVRGHQIDELGACTSAISDQRGAVGYDDDAVAAGRTDGITVATLDQWRRASAPTLPVLQWAPAATSALSITGPTGYLKAGSTATFHVSGAAPGNTVCVSGIGAAHRVVAPASGSFAVALTMPAGTANRTATAAVSGSADALQVQVLGAKNLTVTPARKTKHRGTKVRVTVTGLAPAEQVRLRFRGVTVKTGVADPSGRFTRLVKVGHRLGKARIAAWGQFSTIRNGHAVIRVVR